MRRMLLLIVTVVGLGLTLPTAAAAQSDRSRPPSNISPCTGSATITGSPSFTVDPRVSGGVYTLPIEGSASYQGSVPEGPAPRPISGKVEILTPWPLPNISIDDSWTWDDDEATGFESSGTVSWDLPSIVPRGVEITVSGFHKENGVEVCSGKVTVEFAGSVLDSVLAPVALVGTAIAAGLTLFAGITKGAAK